MGVESRLLGSYRPGEIGEIPMKPLRKWLFWARTEGPGAGSAIWGARGRIFAVPKWSDRATMGIDRAISDHFGILDPLSLLRGLKTAVKPLERAVFGLQAGVGYRVGHMGHQGADFDGPRMVQ